MNGSAPNDPQAIMVLRLEGPSLLRSPMDIDVIVDRVRAEFNEMPGLRLTMAQAARLWNLEVSLCERVVERLVRLSFLRRTDTGSFVRSMS